MMTFTLDTGAQVLYTPYRTSLLAIKSCTPTSTNQCPPWPQQAALKDFGTGHPHLLIKEDLHPQCLLVRDLEQNLLGLPAIQDLAKVAEVRQRPHNLGDVTAQPMIPSLLPTYPWEKVATDLFEFQGQHYLLLVDYF